MNVTLEHLYPTLNRQHKESRKAYMAFLLWAVQDPNTRSVRLAARALCKSESLFRRWRGKWGWDDRMIGVDQPDIVVLCFLRNLIKGSDADLAAALRASISVAMPSSSLFQNLTMEDLQDKLADGIVLSPKIVQPPKAYVNVHVNAPPEAKPEPEAKEAVPAKPVAPQIVHMPGPAASVMPEMEEVEEDFRQMRKLVQLGRAYILSQLRERKVRVTIADILTLQKAAFLMYGGPVAIRQARESGDKGKYLAALSADLDEQKALIGALISDPEPDESAAK